MKFNFVIKNQMENPGKNWINWPLARAILSLLEVLPVRTDSVGTI